MEAHHATSVHWSMSPTCLVDQHSALPDRTVCGFRRLNCQSSAVECFRSQQHNSGTVCPTTSRQPIRCRLSSSSCNTHCSSSHSLAQISSLSFNLSCKLFVRQVLVDTRQPACCAYCCRVTFNDLDWIDAIDGSYRQTWSNVTVALCACISDPRNGQFACLPPSNFKPVKRNFSRASAVLVLLFDSND